MIVLQGLAALALAFVVVAGGYIFVGARNVKHVKHPNIV